MSIFVPWLVDAARLTGYPVVEVAGWKTRGHGGMRVVEGVVNHHTAGPTSGNYPSLNVVTNGRVGLAGPLSQLGLGRDGTIYVIAAGVAYHAGASAWAGFVDLNDEFLGIEAESTGTSDDWTPEQRDCYPRLCASLLYYMKRPASRSADHKEVAVPAGRKIDRAYWNPTLDRERVAYLLADPLNRIPRFKEVDDQMSWDEMITLPNGRTYKARDVLSWTNFYVNQLAVQWAKLEGTLTERQAALLAAIENDEPVTAVLDANQLNELKAAIQAAKSETDAEAVIDKLWERLSRSDESPTS